MEILGTIITKVDVDPIKVIEALRNEEIGRNSWVFKEEGSYFKGFEVSAGSHSIEDKALIRKGTFDFVTALDLVKDYLTKKQQP